MSEIKKIEPKMLLELNEAMERQNHVCPGCDGIIRRGETVRYNRHKMTGKIIITHSLCKIPD